MSETPVQVETQSSSAGAQVTEGTPAVPSAAGGPSSKPIGATGRKRPPEEIDRAKASAALTRKVNADPSLLKASALSALQKSGGVGPAMLAAFGEVIEKDFSVTFGKPALRSMLERLKKAGILASRKFGTRYDWTEGTGKPAPGAKAAGKPGPKPSSGPKGKPGRKPAAASAPARIKLKGVAGRPRAFKGGDAAAALVQSLSAALSAAQALQGEIAAVSQMRDQLQQIIRQLK
jgi:hypothetical protein